MMLRRFLVASLLIGLTAHLFFYLGFNLSDLCNTYLAIGLTGLVCWISTLLSTWCIHLINRKWPTLNKLWPFLMPNGNVTLKLHWLLLLLLMVMLRFLHIIVPIYEKKIVDNLKDPDSFKYQLIFIVTVMRFLSDGFYRYCKDYLWEPIRQNLESKLEIQMFTHLHSLSVRWHQNRKSDLALRVVDRGSVAIETISKFALFTFIPAIIDTFTGVALLVSTFNGYYAVLLVFAMGFYLVATVWIAERRRKMRKQKNELLKKCGRIASDSLQNYETVKFFCTEQREVERYTRAQQCYRQAEQNVISSNLTLNLVQNVIQRISMLIGSLFIVHSILDQPSSLTVGDYILFTSVFAGAFQPLTSIGEIYRHLQNATVDMEDMLALLNEKPEVEDKPDAPELQLESGCIEFEGVTFGYVPERTVLKDVSFRVSPGETLALVGTSGCGKTTIVRLLFRLFDVSSGRILFDGMDIREVTCKSVRETIGIVPQDTVLFNETIKYNIAYGDPDTTTGEIIEAAKQADIHNRIMEFPDGYSTMVGERGVKLSGGEKQRVAIARALLKKPHIILLDEATSALDTNTERAIQQSLRQVCANRTTIIVAHRLSTIAHADQIIVLEEGRIVERGRHSELLQLEGRYHHLWTHQQMQKADEAVEISPKRIAEYNESSNSDNDSDIVKI